MILKVIMISKLDDLTAVAKLISFNPKLLKDRKINIASGFTFTNHMPAMVCKLASRNEHRNFISVMRPHGLANTVVSCRDGDCLVHQSFPRFNFRAGEFGVKV